MSASAVTLQDEKFKSLGLQKSIVNKEQVCCYGRDLGAVSEKNPVLVLIHGYPQSSYMWRHLIPLLSKDTPIFAPDLPGYGVSAAIEKNDKLTVGNTLMSALKTEVKRVSSKSIESIPVVLIGHDRGARIAHRLAVSGVEGVSILGVCLIDIVPTIEQWAASSRANEVVGYFHWPFLANVDLANRMIAAFGGDKWCNEMILRWAGKNPKGLEALKADDALHVYTQFFLDPKTIDASNKDYEAGATIDIQMQKEDQEVEKKLSVPLLVVYSEYYIGRRYNFPDVWGDWVKDGVKIDNNPLGDGIGHFCAEEAPEESAKAINRWLKGLSGDR